MKLPSEYNAELPIRVGTSGKSVRLVQEWLSLNKHSVKPDGKFGPATEAAVRDFQRSKGLTVDGVVGRVTFEALTDPIRRAVSPLEKTPSLLQKRVIAAAKRHLREHPREVGGQNAGPWVRLYTGGKEGPAWAWCAGFVTTMLRLAEEGTTQMSIRGSLSCDVLVAQAKKAGKFASETEVRNSQDLRNRIHNGALFVVRNAKNAQDWIHTGIVTSLSDNVMETIEGNTNDSGDREGYEVCKRKRGLKNMDFILLD